MAIKIEAVYRVSRTNKVVRVLSGASCLCEVITFENTKDIPEGLQVISVKQAAELTGNYHIFRAN